MTSKEFIMALEDIGYEPRAYSGRGMYGSSCVGVDVEDLGHLFQLGYELAANSPDPDGTYPSAPSSDSMGMGYILYWRNFDWPE